MNFSFPSFFAASRTRSSPLGPLSRLGVRHGLDCCVFSLVQRPSLRNLRRRSPALVRLLRWYYAAVRLPAAVHEGLTAHRVLPPARLLPAGGNGVSRFSRMEFLCMPGVFDSAGPRARLALATARVVAFLPALTPSAP